MQQVSQVALVTMNPHPGIAMSYKSLLSKRLGATQIAIGAICVVLQIVLIALRADYLYVQGTGIWCGIFFIISGSFGVQAGKNKRRGFVITSMVLSIVAASVFAGFLIYVSLGGVALDSSPYHLERLRQMGRSNILVKTGLAIHSVVLILALLEAIIAIISAALCCRPLCCYKTRLYVQGPVRVDEQMGQQVMVSPLTTKADGQRYEALPPGGAATMETIQNFASGELQVNVNDKLALINEKAEA